MAIGQIVRVADGWGEIVESSQSRFGSTNFRIVGDFGDGWYSSLEVQSAIEEDDDDSSTSINYTRDTDGKGTSTQGFDEDHDWKPTGADLPWNPEPTAEWDGELNQLPDAGEETKIDLTPTNSLKGVDVNPDPEDHNAIFEHRNSSAKMDDDENSSTSESQPFQEQKDVNTDQEETGTENWEKKKASMPRKAFASYLALVESDKFVREAAWKDVRKKAARLWHDGDVIVRKNDGREIVAQVDGDHGRYDVQVHRKNAFGQGITWYDCTCEWGQHAYKRQRTFIGRLCSHGLAAYYAMQAGVKPTKDVKFVENTKIERHTLAGLAPEEWDARNHSNDEGSSPEDIAPASHNPNAKPYDVNEDPWNNGTPPYIRSAGVFIWDDNPHKILDKFINGLTPEDANPPAAETPADPAGLEANPVDSDFSGTNSPNPDPNAYVRTAEFEKNPNTDTLFEDPKDPEDDSNFNDVSHLEDDNDPEFAVYDHFWGRSSNVEFKAPATPFFVRRTAADVALDHPEDHTPAEIQDTISRFKLNGDEVAAKKIIDERRKLIKQHEGAASEDGKADYDDTDQQEPIHYQEDPNEGISSDFDGGIDGDFQYDDGDLKGEEDSEWNEFEPDEDADDEYEHDGFPRSSSYDENEVKASAFNLDSSDVVKEFQKSAAGQALFSDSPQPFRSYLDDQEDAIKKTSGRHFNFAEQEELINEPGEARHLAELNLDDTFYLD